MKKIPGFDFLKNHPKSERQLDLPEDKVIVNKKEWEQVVEFFQKFPDQIALLK